MISIDKLKSITHLVTHASCPDGIASALVVKDALPDVKVSFVVYGSEEHRKLEPTPGMLFCDFAPLRDRVQEFVAAGSICLDHHPTARDIVEAFGDNGVFGLNEKNECGAWLAYEHVWLPIKAANGHSFVREFAELAAIRDTWKKDDPRWQQACEQAAEMIFWGYEHRSQAIKSGGIPGWAVRDERLGKHLLDKQLSAAQRSLEEGHRFFTDRDTQVCMFQGVSTTSDAAELAEAEERPLADINRMIETGELNARVLKARPEEVSFSRRTNLVVGFHYRSDAGKLQLQFSMRSHTGFDCSAFAKAHGGGGHKAAAGFTVEVSPEVSVNPYRMFELLLGEWETGQ